MSSQHEYEELPNTTSIRLLRVDSIDNGLVNCTIKTVDLTQKPLYHAVSYTWGKPHSPSLEIYASYSEQYPPGHKETIILNDKSLSISRNAYDFLITVPKTAWTKRCNRPNPQKLNRTFLHHAAISGNTDSVKTLLSSKVDVDAKDEWGVTPLSYAAQLGHVEAVRVLLDAGADCDVKDGNGDRAVDYARRGEYVDIVQELENTERKRNLTDLLLDDGPQDWCWIDQICIDQSNITERGSQVSLMDQIYQKAEYTLIWLGPDDAYTETAVRTIQKLFSAGKRWVQHSDIKPYTSQPEEVYEKANVPYISNDEWTALAMLFLRPYFRRLWVVQENILSDTTIGYCGSHEIRWRNFVSWRSMSISDKRLSGQTHRPNLSMNSPLVPIEREVVSLVQWTDRHQNREKAAQPKLYLENLVLDTWTFQAADPRDKIFGLYGLLRHELRWKPDYTISVEQVFAQATKQMIKDAGNLSILSAILDPSLRQILTLPSWIPDYSVSFSNMMCATFNADGGLPMNVEESPWNVLTVSAVRIDSILSMGSTTSGPLQQSMLLDAFCLELALLLPSPYHNQQPRTEALWRTLCADQNINGTHPAPESYGESFRDMLCKSICMMIDEAAERANHDPNTILLVDAFYHFEQAWLNPILADMSTEELVFEFSDPGSNLSGPENQTLVHLLHKLQVLSITEQGSWTPTVNQIMGMYYRSRKFLESSQKSVFNEGGEFWQVLKQRRGRRRLFVTEKRYLGLGPASIIEGDEVWIIPGSGATFILRKKQEGAYEVVGEAYVHGIMNGEGVGSEASTIQLV